MKLHHVLLGLAFGLGQTISAAAPPSAYAGQQLREIKALSPDEVSSLLDGKGAGLAKAAELNGYPGPAHVLELANELKLTAEQRKRTEALFASMQTKAMAAGRELVDAERTLDRLFAEKTATPELVSDALDKIAQLQARVREAHLDAHLAQAEVLTLEQNAMYVRIRGYDTARAEGDRAPHHMH